MQINVADIIADDEIQSRAEMDTDAIADYARDMRDGAAFEPIDVYHDGERYWLADGFHRLAAAQRASLDTIAANVHAGSSRDAKLHSLGANSAHGVRRTNADKRRAVIDMLTDDEWQGWSNRKIADICRVTHPFVAKVRRELSGNRYQLEDSAIEGRLRLGYQGKKSTAEDIRRWIGHLRFEVRVMVELLDDTKSMLSPAQYAEWRASELSMNSESEQALREIAQDETPAFIDGYLEWWAARQSIAAAS